MEFTKSDNKEWISKDTDDIFVMPRDIALERVDWIRAKPISNPIPPEQIVEVLTADVVIVGAGISGLAAANAAAEAGAKVIAIDKLERTIPLGMFHSAVGSRRFEERGIHLDKEEMVAELMRSALFKADQRLIRLWVDKSGEAVDWLLDMAEKEGLTHTIPFLKIIQHSGQEFPFYQHNPGIVLKTEDYVPILVKNARDRGARILYLTAAVQLLKDNRGRVTGVIAQTRDGYIRVNGKAMIICTGGYEGSRRMLRKYIPEAKAIVTTLGKPRNHGDGFIMAQSIGADMDPPPHCPIFFDGGIPDWPMTPLTRMWWLNVNTLGERYVCEDTPFGLTCLADYLQPGHQKWVVFDDKWQEDAPKLRTLICKSWMFHNAIGEGLVFDAIKKGVILSADTLKELAKKMDVPFETFKGTVERYNELAKLGKDLDFYKHPSKLTTIEKPPFYAVKTGITLLVTVSGLRINTKLQVLDTAQKPIPGLYAAGNASGGFFAYAYPTQVAGASLSRAITFGYLAGRNAATETL